MKAVDWLENKLIIGYVIRSILNLTRCQQYVGFRLFGVVLSCVPSSVIMMSRSVFHPAA